MVGYKQAICVLTLTTLSGLTMAQNNTNSPYTRFGYGQLSDQSFGNSIAMGGMSYGLRDGSQINASNPASYTAIDSLVFLFDGGITLQNTNFTDGAKRVNAKNSSLDYVAMQFRLNKRLGMSAGLLPFSNVGYNLSQSAAINGSDENTGSSLYQAYGDGGLHQLYIGAGFKILKNLSVGANVSYLFGAINRSVVGSIPSDGNSNAYYRNNEMRVKDYKIDLGLQYTQYIGKKNAFTLGLVYSPKHSMNNTETQIISTSVADTTSFDRGYDLPNTFGAGLTYVYNKQLTIGFDYTMQQWSKAKYEDKIGTYLCDRSKYSLGAEYQPNAISNKYLSRIKYRVGAFYSDPYVLINNIKGAREYGVTAGFGLPVFSGKSILNISGQYSRVQGRSSFMINEDCMKISIGLTFNERWFTKWKVE